MQANHFSKTPELSMDAQHMNDPPRVLVGQTQAYGSNTNRRFKADSFKA